MKTIAACLLSILTAFASFGQGTLVFDQESSTDENYVGGGGTIQFYGTVGQSFTPSLATVGFFRVKLRDQPDNFLGATLAVNLRSNAISGPLLGTTTPVVLADGFNSSVDFYLPSAVVVSPGRMYFFQVVVQSGDNVSIAIRQDSFGDANYSGGDFYGGGFPFTGADLWFREGIIVPEPSSLILLFVGGSLATWYHRRKYRA